MVSGAVVSWDTAPRAISARTEDPTMMEIKLCGTCGKYRCCDHNTPRAVEVNPATMRACSDCEAYAPAWSMTAKQDGRVICPSCQKAIDARAREQAQKDMFVSQPALF